ncbi:N-acetyltransferase [Halobacillus fulvus]|nr:N-acetyltransferase [Halobacillus fulvus]
MKIETQRLRIRKYTEKDFDFLYHLLSDPEMVRYIGQGQTKDEKGTQQFLNWIYGTYEYGLGRGLMVLEHKTDRTPIGHAGLVPQLIDGMEELEIGYWISRDHWGNGYATEAAKALKDYAVIELEERRLVSLIQAGNLASIHVASKLGMELERKMFLNDRKVYLYSSSF